MESLIAILALTVLAVPVLLIVALASISTLKGRVSQLEAQLARVQAQLAGSPRASAPAVRSAENAPVPATDPGRVEAAEPVGTAPAVATPTSSPKDADATISATTAPERAGPPSSPPSAASSEVIATPETRVDTTSPSLRTEAGDASAEAAVTAASAGGTTKHAPPGPGSPAEVAPTSTAPGSTHKPPSAPPPSSGPVIQAIPVAPQRPSAGAPQTRSRPIPAAEAEPGFDLGAVVRGWFTEGNVPVKVGVLVLLIGVAALLKYASDQGWLRITIGMRLMAITAAALFALGFAWRKRHSHRTFALTVQGGAIGVLLLVVYAAFKLYGMLPLGIAFPLSVLLVVALGVLSVFQDARVLAVLGIFAGFLAPIWLSTGSGNHVVLFSYYALLNAGIFGIAWMRSWRELNLMGWVFTWGIGMLWGAGSYDASRYATTQPFLLLFFFLYLLLPILSERREAPGRRGFVNGSLIFGTPLVAFSLQSVLFEGEGKLLALCALGLSAMYAALWWWLRQSRHPVLAGGYGVLAAGFATLAVPLALSARATSAVFALEGAGLVWLGLRQRRVLPQLSGAGLQLAAALAFAIGSASSERAAPIFANPAFMGALLLAVAGFACAWWYRSEARDDEALGFYGWGVAWWAGNVLLEVLAHVDALHRADVLLVFIAVTAVVAAEVHRRRPAAVLPLTVLSLFILAAVTLIAQVDVRGQPLEPEGAAAWLAFAVCGVRSLMVLRGNVRLAPTVQFVWVCVWTLLATLSLLQLSQDLRLGGGWQLALATLPLLLLTALVLEAWRRVRWPLGEAFDGARKGLLATCITVLGVVWVLALPERGASQPLTWLPLLNPLEVTLLLSVGLLARWLWSPLAPAPAVTHRATLLSLAVFILATNVTLRSVHHLGREWWGPELWSSSLAQMSLTIVWSVLGVVAWIAGSKGGKRPLWLAGAVLMAVVLAKLVLVDRQHLGDLLGIGSFFAYGLMCTLVGWFAPAPPREGAGGENGKAA